MNRFLLGSIVCVLMLQACTHRSVDGSLRDASTPRAQRTSVTRGATAKAATDASVDLVASPVAPSSSDATDTTPSSETRRLVAESPRSSPQSHAQDEACKTPMSESELCTCLRESSLESEPGTCEVQTLAAESESLRTPGGDLYVIAHHGRGFFALGRLHSAGMEDFAVRSARVENAGPTRVLRLVTFTQIGSNDWLHTANQVVYCPLTAPRDVRSGCFAFPLYAHTREMVSDVANEQESKFRVALTTDGSAIVRTRGELQHPELRAELGEQRLRRLAR
jgi:hypothetical protein